MQITSSLNPAPIALVFPTLVPDDDLMNFHLEVHHIYVDSGHYYPQNLLLSWEFSLSYCRVLMYNNLHKGYN